MHQHYNAQDGQTPILNTVDSGLNLTEAEREMIGAVNGVAHDLPIFEVFIWRRLDDGTLLLSGTCPLCGLEHSHGLSRDARRVPHCSTQLPPFRDKPKPMLVRLRVQHAPIPDDLRFALEVGRPDLLAMAAVALPAPKSYGDQIAGLHDSHKIISARSRKYTRERFRDATRALANCGIFDERAAIMIEDSGEDALATYRHLVAAFIAKQGPGRWRLRLARALKKAWSMRGRGETVQ